MKIKIIRILSWICIAISIFCLFKAVTAHAETPIDIVAVTGPYGLTDRRIMALWNRVDRSYDRAGSPVRLRSFRRIPEVSNNRSLGYSTMVARLYDYAPYADSRYKTIFIVPPIQQYAKLWLTGVAEIGCGSSIGWAAAMEENQDGAPRFLVSALAVKHELAHARGATHTELNPSIMWPDALSLFVQGWRLKWLRKTKQEFQFCDGGISPRAVGLEVLPRIN